MMLHHGKLCLVSWKWIKIAGEELLLCWKRYKAVEIVIQKSRRLYSSHHCYTRKGERCRFRQNHSQHLAYMTVTESGDISFLEEKLRQTRVVFKSIITSLMVRLYSHATVFLQSQVMRISSSRAWVPATDALLTVLERLRASLEATNIQTSSIPTNDRNITRRLMKFITVLPDVVCHCGKDWRCSGFEAVRNRTWYSTTRPDNIWQPAARMKLRTGYSIWNINRWSYKDGATYDWTRSYPEIWYMNTYRSHKRQKNDTNESYRYSSFHWHEITNYTSQGSDVAPTATVHFTERYCIIIGRQSWIAFKHILLVMEVRAPQHYRIAWFWRIYKYCSKAIRMTEQNDWR